MSAKVSRNSRNNYRSSFTVNTAIPAVSGPATHCGAQSLSEEIRIPSMKRAGTADNGELNQVSANAAASATVSFSRGLECPAGIKVNPIIRTSNITQKSSPSSVLQQTSPKLAPTTPLLSSLPRTSIAPPSGILLNQLARPTFSTATTAPQLGSSGHPSLGGAHNKRVFRGFKSFMTGGRDSKDSRSRISSRSSSVPPGIHSSDPSALFTNFLFSSPTIKPIIGAVPPLSQFTLPLRGSFGSHHSASGKDGEWTTVTKKKKNNGRAHKVKFQSATQSMPTTPLRTRFASSKGAPAFYIDDDPLDANEYYSFKCQASTFNKRGKMGHGHKEVERVAFQTQKRNLQSAKQRGMIPRNATGHLLDDDFM